MGTCAAAPVRVYCSLHSNAHGVDALVVQVKAYSGSTASVSVPCTTHVFLAQLAVVLYTAHMRCCVRTTLGDIGVVVVYSAALRGGECFASSHFSTNPPLGDICSHTGA